MRKPVKIALGVVAALVVLAGIGIWWFLRDDSPPPVSLDSAVESVTTTEPSGDAEPAADGIDGEWIVDDETGEFDFETATGTFAGFRIQEELASIGSTTAVGRTGDVGGSITIDGTTVTDAAFEVDMTTITTNERRRDDRVQQALETGQFPTGTFTLTAPIELGDAAADGAPVSATATGDLTIHGVTKSVELPIEAQLTNGTIVIVASLDITFSDYGVAVPQSQIVLSVEDHGVMELQLLLTRH